MSDDEFKKLLLEKIDIIDGRLYRIEGRLSNVEGRLDSMGIRLDGLEGKLNKVEKDIAQFKSDVDGQFTEVKAAIQIVYDGVKEVLDQQEIEAHERVHMDIVLKRHERWITGLANHTKLKLSNS